ncbi:MAG: hypothetical protein FJ297_08065 [Planctomycetes bacterium]|nr:hypothetical protein [Planctomycetota bacterium]
MRDSDIRVRSISTRTERIGYRTPIKFGGRVVTDAVIVEACAEVETRDGRRGSGLGSMPMGNAWAWPSARCTGEQTLRAMLAMADAVATGVSERAEFDHPIEITHAMASSYDALAERAVTEAQAPESMPKLAQLVAASPIEAAIHDAHGKTLGVNSYRLLGPDHWSADLGRYLDDSFRGEHLDRYTLVDPKPSMPLYHLVGALDPLDVCDAERPVGDGLPETLAEWIVFNGLTHLKIKLAGDDLEWDLARVSRVERVASETHARHGTAPWCYSLDFNERCANVDYVLEFLVRLESESPDAYRRTQYLEQPTHRDLRAHRENRMHRAAKLKPVVIDESLVDYESLLLAREQGYSGVALKACKGHAEALLMGAAAQKFGMFLCVQDLTCVGPSFLHSASLAARLPTIRAIEGNGRQYCPAGNRGWEERYPSMFRIGDGRVGTHCLTGPGLY